VLDWKVLVREWKVAALGGRVFSPGPTASVFFIRAFTIDRRAVVFGDEMIPSVSRSAELERREKTLESKVLAFGWKVTAIPWRGTVFGSRATGVERNATASHSSAAPFGSNMLECGGWVRALG
jgi:hypothetical protein